MPDITVTIPANAVADLTVMAEEKLGQVHVDYSQMTAVQKAKRFIAELLKDQLVEKRRRDAQATAQAAVQTAVTAAGTDASGIV